MVAQRKGDLLPRVDSMSPGQSPAKSSLLTAAVLRQQPSAFSISVVAFVLGALLMLVVALASGVVQWQGGERGVRRNPCRREPIPGSQRVSDRRRQQAAAEGQEGWAHSGCRCRPPH